MAAELQKTEILILPDAAAWRRWLEENEDTHSGIWLMLAKKGITAPTSLSYAQALDEALCSGWTDGQKRRYDEAAFLQRFTEIPGDLAAALSSAGLAARFEALGSQERYAMLHQLMTAPSTVTRARRLERMVLRLSGGQG